MGHHCPFHPICNSAAKTVLICVLRYATVRFNLPVAGVLLFHVLPIPTQKLSIPVYPAAKIVSAGRARSSVGSRQWPLALPWRYVQGVSSWNWNSSAITKSCYNLESKISITLLKKRWNLAFLNFALNEVYCGICFKIWLLTAVLRLCCFVTVKYLTNSGLARWKCVL